MGGGVGGEGGGEQHEPCAERADGGAEAEPEAEECDEEDGAAVGGAEGDEGEGFGGESGDGSEEEEDEGGEGGIVEGPAAVLGCGGEPPPGEGAEERGEGAVDGRDSRLLPAERGPEAYGFDPESAERAGCDEQAGDEQLGGDGRGGQGLMLQISWSV